jgi:cation diffusion facilitator CzcD-associated flavoprotein CzcO
MLARRHLPRDYDIDTHFNPRYNPWDERICVVPDADLFEAIAAGRLSVATDEIETFTETGIALASGSELEADIIVTATGLELQLLGGIELSVDGSPVEVSNTLAYRGAMLSGVPNLAFAFGYVNQSWTLGADVTCQHVCRLLNYMDEHGYQQCLPLEPPPSMERLPLLDLRSGYVMRAVDLMPKQGTRPPWRLHQNYLLDRRLLGRGELDDEGIEFSSPVPARSPDLSLAA